MINVEGAIRLARALRSDIGTAAASGVLVPGASMLATGRSKPLTQSTLAITCFNRSRIVTVGGNQIVSGDALFMCYLPIWNPVLV